MWFVHYLLLPLFLRGEAALKAIYTINHLPSPTTHNKSQFELLNGKATNYSTLRAFGCPSFFPFSHMLNLNLNLGLDCVVFLVTISQKKDSVVMTLSLVVCSYPFMSSSRNTRHSLVFMPNFP